MFDNTASRNEQHVQQHVKDETEEESKPLEIEEWEADERGADNVNHNLTDDSTTADFQFHLGCENRACGFDVLVEGSDKDEKRAG